MFFFNTGYFLMVMIPTLLLTMIAQGKVKRAYRKYSQVPMRRGLTGAQVARQILDSHNLSNVPVEQVPGKLSDHYDPRSHVLRLSAEVYQGRSLAAAGIAAHETGHALQHAQGYLPLHLRSVVVPVAGFGSKLGMGIFFIGMLFGAIVLGKVMMTLGIILFSFAVLFSLITLPVEFNASSRALRVLEGHGYLEQDELVGAKKVLDAAALTYVAAAAAAIMNLLYMIMRSRN